MYILLVILLILTATAYVFGRRNPGFQKGTPVLAGISIVLGIYSMRPAEPPEIEEIVSSDRMMGEVFAEKILTDFPEGGGVAVIQLRPEDPDMIMQAIPVAQLAGLQETLGDTYTVYPVDATKEGSFDPKHLEGGRVRQCRDFIHMVKDFPNLVAVVSFAGLPNDVDNLEYTDLPPFYALLNGVFSDEWKEDLPTGVAAVISTRAEPINEYHENGTSLEEFRNKYILTTGVPIR